MTADIHLYDTGTLFKLTIKESGLPFDLTSATVKKLLFKKKNKQVIERDASFFTTGSDGILTYTSASADFDVKGAWEVQAYIETPAGKWHTAAAKFEVGDILVVT